jgi:uncharacterized protein (DUF736 family)
MSQEYDNTNRGVLFKNDDKQSDKHADYRGNINVDGKEFWLDAWIKTSKSDKKYMSLSIKPKLQSDRVSPPTGGRSDPRPARGDGPPF